MPESDVLPIPGLGLVVDVLVADQQVGSLLHQPQELPDVRAATVKAPVQSGETEISQNLETPNHFPGPLKVKAETVLGLLVVERRDSFIPALEGGVVPEEIVVELL